MNKGYDIEALYAACEDRQVRPIMPLRLTPASRRVRTSRRPANTAAGSSPGRSTSRRLPCGAVRPASASPPPVDQGQPYSPAGPRDTDRWRKLYKGRASVEREFGRLKHEWSCCRFAFVALSASSFTPTSPSCEAPLRPRKGASRTARGVGTPQRKTGPAGIPCASESVASARCSRFGCLCSLGAGVDGRRASSTRLLLSGRKNEGVSLVVSPNPHSPRRTPT
jgi:hypothetical protein